MSLYKQKDPQDDRRFQPLRDQHGRLWGATIEISTGDPVGTIDLLDESRKDDRGNYFHKPAAPVMPPPQFMKVNSKRDYGTLKIDYAGWKTMLRRAWDDYNRRMLGIAQQMYKDDAAEKVADPPPALVAMVGIPPEPIGPVEVAEAGDPWMLGLTTERPDWADAPNRPEWVDMFFRAQPKTAKARPDSLAFLDYKKESESDDYPAFVKSAGRGLSLWTLSDGSEFTGKKAEAQEAEAALRPHESWE